MVIKVGPTRSWNTLQRFYWEKVLLGFKCLNAGYLKFRLLCQGWCVIIFFPNLANWHTSTLMPFVIKISLVLIKVGQAVNFLSSPKHMATPRCRKNISALSWTWEHWGQFLQKQKVLVFMNQLLHPWLTLALPGLSFFLFCSHFRKHVHGGLLWRLRIHPSVQTVLRVDGGIQVPLVSQRLLPVHRPWVRGLRQQGCQVHELSLLKCGRVGTKLSGLHQKTESRGKYDCCMLAFLNHFVK